LATGLVDLPVTVWRDIYVCSFWTWLHQPSRGAS